MHSESTELPFFSGQPVCARILVAEDPFISTFLRAILQRRGHKVVIGDAVHASELLRNGSVSAEMVITNRPEAFLALADTVPMLYIAANPDPELATRFPACRVLRKPFRNDDLLEAVEELARGGIQ